MRNKKDLLVQEIEDVIEEFAKNYDLNILSSGVNLEYDNKNLKIQPYFVLGEKEKDA